MKYIVQRDKGWPVTDEQKHRYAFGESFDPDPNITDPETHEVTRGAITEEMCAAGVESGYIALSVPLKQEKRETKSQIEPPSPATKQPTTET